VGWWIVRGLYADRHDVRARCRGRLEARPEAALGHLFLHEVREARLVSPEWALPGVDYLHLFEVDVDADHVRARRGDGDRERQSDVAEPDDGNSHGAFGRDRRA